MLVADPPALEQAVDRAAVSPAVDAVARVATLALTSLGLVGTPLLLTGRFTPLPVLAGTAALTAVLELLWRSGAGPTPQASRRTSVVSGLALLVAAASAVVNARFSNEHLLVDGDPAVYAVAGQLVADTGGVRLATGAETVFGGITSLNFAGVGFDAYDGEAEVRPSFLHLLPEALAVGQWFGGTTGLLWTNAVLGGFALLAVFVVGARLVGRPEWALLAMTTLAVSMPQAHFSRDAFSEVPAQLLAFGGMALLVDAVRRDRVRLAVLSGLALGAGCLARIDTWVSLPPLVVTATVLALAGRTGVARGLVAGLSVGAALGAVDLAVGTPVYLSLQWDELRLVLLALAVTALLCGLVLWRRTAVVRAWERAPRRLLAGTAAAVVVGLAAFAALLRPELQTARGLSPQQPTAVAQLQAAAGQAVDPLRSYDELSLLWLTWYWGPLAVGLGVTGLAALTWWVLRGRPGALLLLGPLLVVGATSALYLYRPSIIPVHYWATRRLLVLTVPALLLAAVWLGSRVPGRLRPVALVAVGAALLGPVLAYSAPRADEREYVPVAAVVERLCEVLQPDDAVLLVDGAAVTSGLPHTLRAFCRVPVASLSATTAAEVDEAARSAAASGRRLVLLSAGPDPAVPGGVLALGGWSPVVDTEVSVVALSLYDRPSERYAFPLTVWRAVVEPRVGPPAG